MTVSLLQIVKKASLLSFYSFNISILLGVNIYFTFLGVVFSFPYFLYLLFVNKFYINRFFLFLYFFLISGALLNCFFTQNGFGGALVIMGALFMTLFIINNANLVYNHVFYVMLLFLFVCFFKILILGVDPNEFYVGMSRNYLGLILVLLNVLLQFLGTVTSHKVPFIVTILSLILSVLLVGRSTIGSMLCLFFLHLVNILQYRKHYIVVVFFLLAGGVMYFWNDLQLLYKASSFGGFGLDTPRYEIWSKFLSSTDFFTHILGIDTFTIPIVAEFNGNLHNEFLNLLARTGIGFWAFVLVFCL